LLYRPKYFHGGVAVHGYTSVPATPASHGCVRVTYAAMDHLWAADLLPIGTPVQVYGGER
jgi:lipoprotein-anchoring transpeptidase ErfK/SrfK